MTVVLVRNTGLSVEHETGGLVRCRPLRKRVVRSRCTLEKRGYELSTFTRSRGLRRARPTFFLQAMAVHSHDSFLPRVDACLLRGKRNSAHRRLRTCTSRDNSRRRAIRPVFYLEIQTAALVTAVIPFPPNGGALYARVVRIKGRKARPLRREDDTVLKGPDFPSFLLCYTRKKLLNRWVGKEHRCAILLLSPSRVKSLTLSFFLRGTRVNRFILGTAKN